VIPDYGITTFQQRRRLWRLATTTKPGWDISQSTGTVQLLALKRDEMPTIQPSSSPTTQRAQAGQSTQ
jgi:hypothetical protein